MLQVTRSGLSFVRDSTWAAQKAAYRERHLARLPDFIEPSLLATIPPMLDAGVFHYADHAYKEEQTGDDNVFATELRLDSHTTPAKLLRFITCRDELFRAIAELVGADDIICGFLGRCFRRLPEHYDGWHRDDIEGRVVGLSLGLQPEPFVGGEFQMSNDRSGVLTTFPPPAFGEATVFDISPHLTHRVRRVKTDIPRISWAGWFLTKKHGPLQDLVHIDDVPPTEPASPNHSERSPAKMPA